MIHTLSAHKQYELYRWFMITSLLFLSIIFIGMYYIGVQLISYCKVRNEVAVAKKHLDTYSAQANAKQSLKKEYDELRLREDVLHNYAMHKKNPYNHLTEISNICGTELFLEAARCAKNTIEITILAPTIKQAQWFNHQVLSSSYFSRSIIHSLQQIDHGKQVRAMITAHMIIDN